MIYREPGNTGLKVSGNVTLHPVVAPNRCYDSSIVTALKCYQRESERHDLP